MSFNTSFDTQLDTFFNVLIFSIDYVDKFPIAIKDISKWLQEGKIKRKEFIIEGLENAPNGLLKLFNGDNTGKMLVKFSD